MLQFSVDVDAPPIKKGKKMSSEKKTKESSAMTVIDFATALANEIRLLTLLAAMPSEHGITIVLCEKIIMKLESHYDPQVVYDGDAHPPFWD
jgi:hypothetical protein